MNTPITDLDTLLRRCRAATEALTDGSAEALLALVPGARLALWRPYDGAPTATVVRTASGAALPDWEWSPWFGYDWAHLEGCGGGIHAAPALSGILHLRCPAILLRDEGEPWAFLALGTPDDSAPETTTLAENVVTICAHFLSLQRQEANIRRERDEAAGFALAGQATIALAHEVNNLLNSMALQASVIQLQVDGQHHAALDVIRRQVHQATALLRPLGRLSSDQAKMFYPVDLVRTIQEVLRERAALAGRVVFAPPPTSPSAVRATAGALKQLVDLLLTGMAAEAIGPLRVGVEEDGPGVQLLVEAAGSPSLDPPTAVWAGLGDLEKLAAQSLLRHLDGTLHVEAGSADGVRVRVVWKGAAA